MKVSLPHAESKNEHRSVQPVMRPFGPAGTASSLPGTALHSAPSHAVIQRMPFDASGNALTLTLSELAALDKTQGQLHTNLQGDGTTHVYRDRAAFLEHVQTGKTDHVRELPGVNSTDFLKGLPKANLSAQRRHGLAPMKLRTTKGGEVVKSTDVPEFAKLTEAEVPPFPEGTHIYRSEKRKNWKVRNTATATKNWKMALYRQKPGTPVGYNMLHDGELVQTRFPYGQGASRGDREMAGLETVDTHQGTPKWSNKKVVGKRGKKRKLNKFPHEAIVQGHGIDYKHTMDHLGDVDASHATPANTLSESIYDDLKTDKGKKRRIEHSDQHPANFSGEHPIYGQNFRNPVLKEAEKNHPGGSFIERTDYQSTTMPVAVPKGFKPPRIPKRKRLSVVNSKGVAQKQFALDQTQPGAKRPFDFIDYAEIAEKHSGKKSGKADMHDLMDASLQTTPVIENPSLVTPTTTTGVNAWTPATKDSPTVQQELALRHGFPFHFLKSKDFS